MRSLNILLWLCTPVFFCSCEGGAKPASEGAPYEVYVTASDELWNGSLGDTLRSVMGAPVSMVNRQEPAFDLFHITPKGINKLVSRHRNLVHVRVGEEYSRPQVRMQYDADSSPQVVVLVSGPDEAALTNYVSGNRMSIRRVIENAERDRYLSYAEKHKDSELGGLIEAKFGLAINIPQGYKLRSEEEDFLWLSNEHPLASQGVVIYRYPFHGQSDFTVENMLARRDEFVGRIPGPSDGSFMVTVHDVETEAQYVKVDGVSWAELHGLWDTANDFMGGPFVSYSTVDKASKMVVCIDCYVYSPQQTKRNYLRELESLVHSARFPETDYSASGVSNDME